MADTYSSIVAALQLRVRTHTQVKNTNHQIEKTTTKLMPPDNILTDIRTGDEDRNLEGANYKRRYSINEAKFVVGSLIMICQMCDMRIKLI